MKSVFVGVGPEQTMRGGGAGTYIVALVCACKAHPRSSTASSIFPAYRFLTCSSTKVRASQLGQGCLIALDKHLCNMSSLNRL